MFDARLTQVVASITAPARSPSVAFTLGSGTGKSSCRFEADLIVVDQWYWPLALPSRSRCCSPHANVAGAGASRDARR
jgi:hypothetical protein